MALQLTRLNVPNLTTDYSAETNAAGRLAQTLGSLPAEWRKQQEAATQKQLLGSLGQDFNSGNFDGAAAKLATLGDIGGAASVMALGQKRKELQQHEEAYKNSPFSGGSTSVAPAGATTTAGMREPPPEIKAIIDRTVPEADREYAYRMAAKESAFNPNAVSPTGAKGLFQFTGGTGRQYGLVDRAGDLRSNPEANTQAFVRFTQDNRNTLRQALGREPTYGELALAHQQGAGGALALLTGKGDINPTNLRVNNADPNADRSTSARRIMAYYGYGDQPAQAQTQRPVQVAATVPLGSPPQAASSVAPIPGDDPVKLRQEAQFYAQTNPEAARQLSARADAAERGAGVQTAQAPAQPGAPVSDAANQPAPGAAEAQFVIPGKQALPPNDPFPQVTNEQVIQVLRNPRSPAGDRAIAQQLFASRQAYAAETAPEKREQARLETQKKALEVQKLEREVSGDGARPMTPEERTAYGVQKGQPAFMTRQGEPKFGPAGTIVKNEGVIPPGFRAIRDADGNLERVEPIPGSKAEQEAKSLAEKKAKAEVMRSETGSVVANALDDIDRLAAGSSLPVAGAIGARISSIPGTAAHDVAKSLETVGANISFGQLQQMRESSPTGGALGAVTERELDLLKNSFASLSQTQSPEQFKTNLGRVRATFERIVHGRTLTATERKTGGPMTPERAQSIRAEAAQAIASGAPRSEVMKRLKMDYGITPEGL